MPSRTHAFSLCRSAYLSHRTGYALHALTAKGFNAARPFHATHKQHSNTSALLLCHHFVLSPSTVWQQYVSKQTQKGGEYGKGYNAAPTHPIPNEKPPSSQAGRPSKQGADERE